MMANVNSFDYYQEFLELQPSLFRESDNLHNLFYSIFTVYGAQQQDFLWLSRNMLDIDVAEGFHLDFIGGLVGQSRVLIDFNSEVYFGFDKSYRSETFGSTIDSLIGGYWNSRSYFNAPSARRLNDSEYRRVIKARIFYNNSNCTANELLTVLNLITNSDDNTVQTLSHGSIKITTSDQSGLLNYFVSRLENTDNILPIAAGVKVQLDSTNFSENILGIYVLTSLLEKLVNNDLPDATENL